jgi:hypothetical protein
VEKNRKQSFVTSWSGDVYCLGSYYLAALVKRTQYRSRIIEKKSTLTEEGHSADIANEWCLKQGMFFQKALMEIVIVQTQTQPSSLNTKHS